MDKKSVGRPEESSVKSTKWRKRNMMAERQGTKTGGKGRALQMNHSKQKRLSFLY